MLQKFIRYAIIQTKGAIQMARILISMQDNFLKSVDEIAQNEHRTRSELIREALRDYLKKAKTTVPKKAIENAKILENLLD